MNNTFINTDLSSIGLSEAHEQKVIRRYVLLSIIITLFYALLTFRDLIIHSNTESIFVLISSLIIAAIFASYFLIKNHLIAKNYITLIFSIAVLFSFFSYGGISGLFIIDLINTLIFTFIVFNTHSLIRYSVFYLLLFGLPVLLQMLGLITFRSPIIYINETIDPVIFILTRLILTINMILYLKSRHNAERIELIRKNEDFEKLTSQLKTTNEELISQNNEVNRQKKLIDHQNDQLKMFQQDLIETNNSLEDRIQIRTEELVNVNNKLKKTLKQLDQFVYSASHDLSAPLKSILGLVHIAKLENKNNNSHEHLNYIEKSIFKQEKVIKDLLQYSRNNKNDITSTPIELSKLIEDVISELSYYPGFDQVKIDTNLEIDQILFDEPRLHMIINNLLSNAIKYRDVDKETSFINIASQILDDHWEIEVEDNGVGIEKDQQSKIFDMFYRANEASDGSGLGLFIVAEAVEKLNGNIKVQSKINFGTKISIRFSQDIAAHPNRVVQ